MSVEQEPNFSREVGRRLRAVRRLRRLSLDDVEHESGGRWSASAIGAYERGFRNLTLPRLRDLASFYGVPMAVLLGEEPVAVDARSGRVTLDLTALERHADAEPVLRYARSIVIERGDYNGRVLSVRRDDLRALCSLLSSTEEEVIVQLRAWDALLDVEPLGGMDAMATGVANDLSVV